MSRAPDHETAALSGLQKAVLAVLAVVLVGSVVARVLGGPRRAETAPAAGAPAGAQGLVAGGTTGAAEEPAPEPRGLERFLPYLTEASLFGLIGFALGYTTRKVFKLALILIAIGFLAVQGLVHAGWLEVDWGGVLEKLNAWIFNLKQSGSLSEFLTDRVPSGGALLVGWVVGFRRG